MRIRGLVCFLLLLAPLAGAVELRFKRGDDPRYARPDWDDRDWEVITAENLPLQAGPYWVRFRLSPPLQPNPRPPGEGYYNFTWPSDEPGAPIDAVVLNPIFSFEFYWDGRLLERGGVVGHDRASEVPGALDHFFQLPAELRGPGEHVVAIRLSSYHFNFPCPFPLPFRLDNYGRRLVEETRRPFIPVAGAGCSLLLAVACLVTARWVERRRPLVWCGVLGLALACYYFLIAVRWLFPLAYHWHYPRLELIMAVMAIIGGLLSWVVAEYFELPHRRGWLVALALVLAGAVLTRESHESRAYLLTRLMLGASAAIAAWAIWRRRPGAWLVLGGTLAGLAAVGNNDGRTLGDTTFFLVVSALMGFVLVAIARQVRAEQRRAREAALTASRLEIELLKKNIQPHFLLNTLTTIMEVIEQEPEAAVALIEALAGEFRILARVSGEKLIPLGQELELCRAHLRIMGLRRGVQCSFEARDVDESSPVPPALFHTLIEGGLTHQLPRAGRLQFVLDGAYQPARARYTLTVQGENPPSSGSVRDGTGLRYVKARLDESFAGRWSLSAGPVLEGWRTVIEIRQPLGESGAL